MKLLERILVPVGLGQESQRVVLHATRLAQAFRAEVVLLHVIPAPRMARPALGGLRRDAAERLAQIRARLAADGVAVAEPLIEAGVPHEVIAARARRLDVNLMVIGAGQRLRWGRVRLGATAERLASRGTKAVWLVRGDRWPAAPKIVCPITFLHASRRVLQSALHVTRCLKGQLEAVALAARPRYNLLARLAGWRPDEPPLLRRMEARLGELLGGFDLHNVPVAPTVLGGQDPGTLLQMLRGTNAGLLVIGATGFGVGGVVAGRRSVWQVVHAAPCSVLLIRGEAPFRVRLEASEEDAEQLYREGEELLRHGLPEQAIRQLQRSVARDPMKVAAWGGLALAYERLGQADRAEEAWQQAWQLRERLWELHADTGGQPRPD